MKFYLAEAEKLAKKYKTRDPERIAKEIVHILDSF